MLLAVLGCGGSEERDAGLDGPGSDSPPRIDSGPPDSGAQCEIDAGRVIDVTACNGHVELCDRRYDEVAYVTTHDAMSSAEDAFRLPNQHYRMWRQLEDGVRGFMLMSG